MFLVWNTTDLITVLKVGVYTNLSYFWHQLLTHYIRVATRWRGFSAETGGVNGGVRLPNCRHLLAVFATEYVPPVADGVCLIGNIATRWGG
jgi:hypothetical protein